ncbi:MAG: hypothetical protein KKE86_16925 [Planctomycetes bacterium]|nr:hypothetical protein [Planctomycetota bacterium]MBU4401000.1 hypothetical protein [Planctomycetota bacterium]MCG2683558.1 hypothetical protein [Planctomycetales bacterium]
MKKENYFLEVQGAGPKGEEAIWARLENLTAEEAAAVDRALKISSRPYGYGTNEAGYYEVSLVPESNLLKNPGLWLASCREAQQGEEFVETSFNLPQDTSWYSKYHIIVMAKQFADLVRGKLGTTQNGDGEQALHRFEVFDEDTAQSIVFDATDTENWGPEDERDGWNGEFWEYRVEETLYRHRSGHWTMISERTHYEAPCSCGEQAHRLEETHAINWLVRHGYSLPPDLEEHAKVSFFAPGPPNPAAKTSDSTVPAWNKDRCELTYCGTIIKRVKSASIAKNVVRVLDAFQEDGWPDRIDDPLDPSKNQQRLHETIKRLNDNLETIRFRADGTGQGIVWELDNRVDRQLP